MLDLRFVIGGAPRAVAPNSLLVLNAQTLATVRNTLNPAPLPQPRPCAGAGLVWTVNGANNHLFGTNPESGRVVRDEVVGTDPVAVAIGYGAAWVANAGNGSITRVPLTSEKIETIGLSDQPSAIATGAGYVWVREQAERQGDPDRSEVEAGGQDAAARQPAARGRRAQRPRLAGDRRLSRSVRGGGDAATALGFGYGRVYELWH